MSRSRPATPVVMIKIAKKVRASTFTAVVRDNTVCGNYKHQHPDSTTQQGSVHINLLRDTTIASCVGAARSRI